MLENVLLKIWIYFKSTAILTTFQGIDFTMSTAVNLTGTRQDVAGLEPIKFFLFLEAYNYQAGLVQVSVVLEKAVDLFFFLQKA